MTTAMQPLSSKGCGLFPWPLSSKGCDFCPWPLFSNGHSYCYKELHYIALHCIALQCGFFLQRIGRGKGVRRLQIMPYFNKEKILFNNGNESYNVMQDEYKCLRC